MIGANIRKLHKLGVCDLSTNELAGIPSSLLTLTSLKSLTLAGNTNTVVPDDIEKLSNLTDLDITENQFTSIPTVIAAIDKLRHTRLTVI